MTGKQRTWMTRLDHARLLRKLSALRSQRSIDVPDDLMDCGTPNSADVITRPSARRARIREIEDLLATARVFEHASGDAIAKSGMVLTIRYDQTGATETFLLGRRGSRGADIKVYSTLSPLGRAIAGARVGEQRIYSIPHGPDLQVTLLKAVPYQAPVKS